MGNCMSEQRASKPQPFKTLGTRLKYLRENSRQSLAEVAGSVEIDASVLELIEQGTQRPNEEILLLLINHFNIEDLEALQLWELAGYGGDVPEQLLPPNLAPGGHKASVVMLMATDNRTLYSDAAEITADPAGITMNFLQASAHAKQVPVARVGMSQLQAERVLESLQQALLKVKYLSGPKALPPSTDSK